MIMSEQKGVFRVNCIDCLDRTNVVQVVHIFHLRCPLVHVFFCSLHLPDMCSTGN